MDSLENKIKILESENNIKEEKIEILTEIVVNMQRSLNRVDGHTRSNNVIITGLSEKDIKTKFNGNDIILKNDTSKVKHLLSLIRCNSFSADELEQFEIERIGKPRDGYSRAVKVKLASTNKRNVFMENAKGLKTLGEPWNTIFIKKDLHQVYMNENTRIRKKLRTLKEDPVNEGKEIKIVNGVLKVNQVEVDRNTFFR